MSFNSSPMISCPSPTSVSSASSTEEGTATNVYGDISHSDIFMHVDDGTQFGTAGAGVPAKPGAEPIADTLFQLPPAQVKVQVTASAEMEMKAAERPRTVSSDTSISSLRSEEAGSAGAGSGDTSVGGTSSTVASGPVSPSSGSFPKTGKRGCPQQFPRKLYDMIDAQTREAEGKEEVRVNESVRL